MKYLTAVIALVLLAGCGSGSTSVGVDRSGTIAISQTEGSGPLGLSGGSNTTVLDPNQPTSSGVSVSPPVGVACPIFDANGNIVCSCESLKAGAC